MESKKCLVTGATGFLGTNLVHELVKDGWEVKALGLPGSNIDYISELPVEIIFGDITDFGSMLSATKDCDVVFHVAGDTTWWKKRFDLQRKINVDGSENVAKACAQNKVKRLIYTSSIDVLGFNPKGVVDEEWSTYNYSNTGYNYADTKREGLQRVLKYNGEDLEVVVIYPGSMMGPFDFTLQYGRLFFDLRDGKVPGIPKGGVSFGHVKEVAKAHIAAAKIGQPAEGYICAGENISYQDLFQKIADKFNKKAPSLVMPKWLLVAYGYILQFISNFTNKPPEVDPGVARYLSINAFADSTKATRKLNYKIVSIEQMIDDAYNWFIANGLL